VEFAKGTPIDSAGHNRIWQVQIWFKCVFDIVARTFFVKATVGEGVYHEETIEVDRLDEVEQKTKSICSDNVQITVMSIIPYIIMHKVKITFTKLLRDHMHINRNLI